MFRDLPPCNDGGADASALFSSGRGDLAPTIFGEGIVNYDELLKSVATGTIMSLIPFGGTLFMLYQTLKISGKLNSEKSEPTPTENLIENFKAGKEQGLSELEVEMDKSTAVGINLGVLSDFGGISINPEFESKNHILIKVKYK